MTQSSKIQPTAQPAPLDPDGQIGDAQFAASWVVLQNRHRLVYDEQTMRIYKSILVVELTAGQFATACRASFRFDEFFPTPQKLIDYGRGRHDFKTQARAVWDGMIDRMIDGQTATDPGTPERAIVARLAAGEQLDRIPHERLYWIKREFVERYVAHLEDEGMKKAPAPAGAAALGSGQPAHALAAGLDEALPDLSASRRREQQPVAPDLDELRVARAVRK